MPKLGLYLPEAVNARFVAAILSSRFAHVSLELGVFARKTTLPARRITTDHRGIDEQSFPSPGRAQCSRDDGIGVVSISGLRASIALDNRRLDSSERFIVRGGPCGPGGLAS
jgi:hypothetical protein